MTKEIKAVFIKSQTKNEQVINNWNDYTVVEPHFDTKGLLSDKKVSQGTEFTKESQSLEASNQDSQE